MQAAQLGFCVAALTARRRSWSLRAVRSVATCAAFGQTAVLRARLLDVTAITARGSLGPRVRFVTRSAIGMSFWRGLRLGAVTAATGSCYRARVWLMALCTVSMPGADGLTLSSVAAAAGCTDGVRIVWQTAVARGAIPVSCAARDACDFRGVTAAAEFGAFAADSEGMGGVAACASDPRVKCAIIVGSAVAAAAAERGLCTAIGVRIVATRAPVAGPTGMIRTHLRMTACAGSLRAALNGVGLVAIRAGPVRWHPRLG